MAFDFVAALAGKPFFELLQTTINKIHHGTTAGAYQVMMVLRGSAQKVIVAVTIGVYPAQKAESVQKLQGAVNSDQPHLGALFPDFLVYGGRGKVNLTRIDCLYQCAPLMSQFVSPLAKCVKDSSFRRQ